MSIDETWKKYKIEGISSAKDDLILNYVSIVKIIAGKLYSKYNGNVEYDDLLGYGVVGLIDAIEKFDIDKKVKFETYANIRIRGAIVDQLRVLDWVPRSTRQKYKMVEEAIAKLQGKYGGEFSNKQLAEELNITFEEVSKLLSEIATYSVVSLDEKINENANFNLVSKNEELNPSQALDKNEMKKSLKEAINKLPEKEMLVMQLYYYSDMTYKEIAKIISVSESRVSQIHSKAIVKLRISIND